MTYASSKLDLLVLKNHQLLSSVPSTKSFVDLDRCHAYIDDVIIYSNTWGDHLRIARAWVFEKLSRAKLTINPLRRNVTHAKVTYLGHAVGLGEVKPV